MFDLRITPSISAHVAPILMTALFNPTPIYNIKISIYSAVTMSQTALVPTSNSTFRPLPLITQPLPTTLAQRHKNPELTHS